MRERARERGSEGAIEGARERGVEGGSERESREGRESERVRVREGGERTRLQKTLGRLNRPGMAQEEIIAAGKIETC